MATAGAILLVDDEDKILKTLGRALRADGHRVAEASSGQAARQLLAAQDFDLVILDNLMPDVSGLDLIREIVGAAPESERPQIVMMTAHATIERAIEAMKLGALDFLQKPFEIDELLVVASRAVEHQRLRTHHRYLINQLDEAFDHYGIVGRSKAMQAVIERAELVARAIHDRSAQRAMPLIRVNCAAIPDTLLESELFGHVRGAFTGAVANKKGRFALAQGGTILLDEVATLGPPLQAKLLRVLQEREFEPLGSERTERVDVRVIAATNRDLRQLVAEGRFQEDLFYRLNVIPIEIPPLRERREDIPVLVEHFLRKHAQRTGKRIEHVEEGVASAMQQYDWPGNVRELENTVERAVVLSRDGTISVRNIAMIAPPSVPAAALPSLGLRQNIEWAERETIRRALDQSGGVKKDAAEIMGISQRALSYYLRKYRID